MGQAYFDNGLGYRTSPGGSDLQSGEVYFAEPPTVVQLQAAFPGYNAAIARQQAQVTYDGAIAAGLTVTSTSTPSLDGTYALDAVQQANLANVALYITVNSKFPGGQSALALRTVSGTLITVSSTAVWQTIATAVADYVTKCTVALQTAQQGGKPTWPSASVTIP